MIHLVWKQLLSDLLVNGEDVAPRGKPTKEIIGHQLVLEDLRDNIIGVPERKLNYRFMVAEWLWIIAGRNDVAALTMFNPKMLAFSDDGQTLAGAYGPRIFTQLQYVIETLRADPDSRQAVIVIWKPTPAPSKDIPCTLTLQFLNRFGQLHVVVNMRSSDAWLGIPYDIFSFSQITNCLAGELGLQTGSLILNMGSSHLYQENWDAARAILALDETTADQHTTFRSPLLPSLPPPALRARFEQAAEILAAGKLGQPWLSYAIALRSETSVQALRHLSRLGMGA
jgi:thymidylate synthase